MKTKANTSLTGSDYFVLALDQQMRSAGLPGNISRLVLRLEGALDLHTFREVVNNCDIAHTLAGLRMRRMLPFTKPYWSFTGSNGLLPIAEYKAVLPTDNWGDICNSYMNRLPSLNKTPGIAFDLIAYPDNITDLVLNWHHGLMDARGAEFLLQQIVEPKVDVTLSDSQSLRNNSYSQMTGLYDKLNLPRRLLFARRSLVFIEQVHRQPIVSFAPDDKKVCQPKQVYTVVDFSDSDSAVIRDNCEKIGAGFYWSLFVLSATVRALHAIRIKRGDYDGAYVVPVPQDLRRRRQAGPVLSNHVTFLFYRVEQRDIVDIGGLVASLKHQMAEQVRSELPYSFATAMKMFRYMPLSLYSKILSRPSHGKMATLFFSDTGESLSNMKDFLGLPVLGVYHLAPVPLPPGVAVISGRFRERIHIVLSSVTGCLTDSERELFQETIRVELLGKR